MSSSIVLNGIVVEGLGEGAVFLSMEHYKKEIKKKLGFNAYPGTLNLKVEKEQANLLENTTTIRINGYKSGNKDFGGLDCYKARIKNINGAVIIPDLTRHKDVVEFIAPVYLRQELKIKDGDEIQAELLG